MGSHEFRVGEEVRLISSDRVGVVHGIPCPETPFYAVNFSGGKFEMRQGSELVRRCEPDPSKFRVGDAVVITGSGRRGKILSVIQHDQYFSYTLDINGSHEVAHEIDLELECFYVDKVNHPSHYGGADNPYEVIKIIEHYKLGFRLGNTIKYILRAENKGAPVEDLKKARWYLDREISAREEKP